MTNHGTAPIFDRRASERAPTLYLPTLGAVHLPVGYEQILDW